MYSIEAVFNRKNVVNKSNKYVTHLRVILDRKSIYLKIKHFPKLNPQYWDNKRNQLKPNHPNAWQLNEILHRQKEKINKYCLDRLMNDKPLSLKGIKENFYGKEYNLTTWAEKYIKTKNLGTYKKYNSVLNHITNSKLEFRFEVEFLSKFRIYLTGQGMGENSQYKLFSMLRTLYKEAARSELIHNYNEFLFDFLRFDKKKPKRTALLMDEVLQLYNYDFTTDPEMNLWKDQFVFQCLSGLYYSDLKMIEVERDIQRTGKGLFLTNERIKTGNTFVIPLWIWPEQLEIVEKYKKETGALFPRYLSDQKYNSKLKTIGETAGIKKKLTNKVGRHTFADLCISRGINEQFVSKMLGHTEQSTTKTYYDMSIEHFAKNIE